MTITTTQTKGSGAANPTDAQLTVTAGVGVDG